MTLNFTILALGFLGLEDINNLPFHSKEERINLQKKAVAELLDNARKNLTGYQIASDGSKDHEIVVCADHKKFDNCAGVEVIIPHLIVADYPADRIEMARVVVWLDTKQKPLQVSRVTSNNLSGITAKLVSDKLTLFKQNGDVLCTAMLGLYLENVRNLFVPN